LERDGFQRVIITLQVFVLSMIFSKGSYERLSVSWDHALGGGVLFQIMSEAAEPPVQPTLDRADRRAHDAAS
jgi:hypothetical protein